MLQLICSLLLTFTLILLTKIPVKCIAVNSLIIQLTSITEEELYLSEVAENFFETVFLYGLHLNWDEPKPGNC